jgi:ribonuclease R
MQGVIELHGAKQVLVSSDPPVILAVKETTFLPGDIAVSSGGVTRLVKRTEQKCIAVVISVADLATLVILNFGAACPFRLTLPGAGYQLGDRLVMNFHADGSFDWHSAYSSDPMYDVKCLLDMYMCPKRAPVETVQGTPLYTKPWVDHRDLATFTIDPTSSVDFDDAISVDVANNTVYIHIVDIANQALSARSLERLQNECYTLYLANEHTEHLLNSKEASFDFSLVVGEERAVITVKIVLEDGCVSSYDIYRSTIIVKQRFDYETVSALISSSKASPELMFLARLTEQRNSDVNYTISLPSVRILSDTFGQVTSVTLEDTNDVAHSLVATAMILANLTVSKHLDESGLVLPNRFHETLRGMQVGDFISTGNVHVDSFIKVKRYARACYAVDKKGHFGLGLKDYVHFTSPMRRYADVIVHRILAGHYYVDLEAEVTWLNRRASLVKTAQDIYMNWKKIRWLKTLPGPHEIWVTGVSRAGILWFMPSLSLNGFLHISLLEPKQFWFYDNDTLFGSKESVKIGDKMTATVVKMDEAGIHLCAKN